MKKIITLKSRPSIWPFKMFIFTAFILNFGLFGCTTNYKKSLELIENKNYHEALTLLDQLVLRDPKDSDYQVAQKKARLGVIDQNLIRVRLSRLAANNQESLETLRKTFDLQQQWNLFPTGAVAFTQSEEINEAYQTLKKEIQQLDQKRKYLRVLYMIARYKSLFTESQQKSFNPFYDDALLMAGKFCLSRVSTTQNNTYYYNQLIQKWCQYSHKKQSVVKADNPLFNSINIKTNQLGNSLNLNFLQQISFKLRQKNLGWFDFNSKQPLQFEATGLFRVSESRRQEFRQHPYTVTENKNPVQKFYPYFVFITEQDLQSQLNLQPSNQAQISFFNANLSDQTVSSAHTFDVPSVQLFPQKTGVYYSQAEWIEKASNYYADLVHKHLEKNFLNIFCDTLSPNQKKSELIHQSLICLRAYKEAQIENIPQIITQTFEAEYEMNSVEMQALFKVID